MIDVAGPSLAAGLVAVVVSIDWFSSALLAVVLLAFVVAMSVGVVAMRYAPMQCTVDVSNNSLSFRNAFQSHSIRLSDVEFFEPRQVFLAGEAARAILKPQGRFTIRAAKYSDFMSVLRSLTPQEPQR